MLADLKFAFRQLRKSPGFTSTAVLTLALGIGANTAIFTLVDSIMLRPLPYPQSARLMRISGFFPKGWIQALGQHSQSFASIAGFGPDAESNVATRGEAERVPGAETTVNALTTLGIAPAAGRFFTPEEGIAGEDRVVVLSYGYWREHYALSPAAIGETLRIDGVWRRVIGVMAPGVRFPYADTQFLVPITFRGGDPRDPWTDFGLSAMGRLKDGVTPAAAQAELRHLHPLLLPLFPWPMPDAWEANTRVVPLLDFEVSATRPRLLLLLAAVGLILLIACANVANLMLARAAGREREIAVRSALGASASRLIRQLLLESLVLGGMAGLVGLAAATATLQALVTLLPGDTPRISDVSLHWPVFLFAAGASLATGFLFGLIPALQMATPDLRESLHAGSRSVAGKAGQFRISRLLVMGQIALSVVVITAAGLMLHSLWSLSKVNPGFRTDRIVTAEVSLDANACGPHGRAASGGEISPGPASAVQGYCQAFFTSLLDRARGIPGVSNVAMSNRLPLSGLDLSYVYDAEGHPRDPHQPAMQASGRTVTPGYFPLLGLQLLRGRLLDEQDESGAGRAAVIDQRMASRLWPGHNPLGKHIIEVADEASPAVWTPQQASVVVGVVGNTRQDSLSGDPEDEIYLPLSPKFERPQMYILVRTRAGMEETADAIRHTVARLDPEVPVTRVQTLKEVLAASESAPRSLTLLLLAFGGLAVAIGGVGVYSLIAYFVSWRTREIGIRLALGAQRRQIVGGVVRQSLVLALVGCGAGLIGAALAAQLLRGFLFEVKAVDPLTFCAVPILMMLLALAAAWVPAHRAVNVDPIRTLRME